jgi:homoserine dehydrogenase
MSRVRIGLLGCGTVGRAFVELAGRHPSLQIVKILVRDMRKERAGVDRRLLTTSALDVIDGDCDVIVELIGGVHSAGAFVRRAIANGRDVITANKALLADCGAELFDAAAERGVTIGFEASVCGAIPIVRVLQRGLAGDEIESIRGVVNGTCNFILSRMEEGAAFADALRCAQERGFAEADPSLDVDGEDAAQKMRILASLAFDAPIVRERLTGIRRVTRYAIERARAGGNVIRLVASTDRIASGVELRVEPRELDANDLLANVRDENNAVIVQARAAGEIVLSGKGAGAMPTASSVLADVLELWRVRFNIIDLRRLCGNHRPKAGATSATVIFSSQ